MEWSMRLAIGLSAAIFLGAASAWADPLVAAQAGSAQHGAFSRYEGARQLIVRETAAALRIDPEDRADVAVSIVNPGATQAPVVRRAGRGVVIDGRTHADQCNQRGVVVGGRVTAWRDLPQIRVRLPRDVQVTISGAVKAEIGPAASARYVFDTCGDVTFGPVRGELDLSVIGSGDVEGGGAGSARVVLAGNGDVALGEVLNGLTISAAGQGDVSTGVIHGGDVRIVAQSGDVLLGSGEVDALTVIVAGSGDVTFLGRAQTLDAVVAGSGDVTVGRVTGRVNRRIAGGGEIVVVAR